jgi:pyruvate dehydrogenase E1 component
MAAEATSGLAARMASADAISAGGPSLDVLERIQDRVLWLAVRMIHEANVVRPNRDGIKVGGHQSSSASVVSILTELYFDWLRRGDLIAVKPHASPAFHAIEYLMGNLDGRYLPLLREFGGLQSYPSRTKDPDPVDFSTGSVGLGAVAPLFASLADRYLRAHFAKEAARWPDRRFVALVGDAELDEGSVWEAAVEDALSGLGNVTMIVDLNRQSLDRVIPGIRVRQIEGYFAAAGWQVVEAKYGRRLQALFAGPGGPALRQRIDDMSNEEYQVMIRRPGPEARSRLIEPAPANLRDDLARSVAGVPDSDLPRALADLGGHDLTELRRALDTADADRTRPSVVFAYTIKGWRLPFAGDSLNHSAHASTEQVHALAPEFGADVDDPWAAFDPESPEGRLCRARGVELHGGPSLRDREPTAISVPAGIDIRKRAEISSQEAFGDALAALARTPELGGRIVSASPDVAVSTNLGGWINRVGVFSPTEKPKHDEGPRLLAWEPKPGGQHIELGISEMNLFMWLSQFGLTAELFGETLIPVGTVYDPFICRGLDAFIYALYVKSQFILVGSPSGVSLAPEGGAHQSSVTPSLGIELPSLHSFEPTFAAEAIWTLLEGVRGCVDRRNGFSTYLRLSTRPIDQSLAEPVIRRLGMDEWRRQVIAGGYRLIEAAEASPSLPPGAPVVQIVTAGTLVPEAVEAARFLQKEEVAANVIVVTSAQRLSAELHGRRLSAIRDRTPDRLDHLATLIPAGERRAPIVTVMDGASHALSFMGSAYGVPVIPLGMDTFGQSGSIPDLYAYAGIDAEHIIEAALLATEIAARD